jgi:hypothetical protein
MDLSIATEIILLYEEAYVISFFISPFPCSVSCIYCFKVYIFNVLCYYRSKIKLADTQKTCVEVVLFSSFNSSEQKSPKNTLSSRELSGIVIELQHMLQIHIWGTTATLWNTNAAVNEIMICSINNTKVSRETFLQHTCTDQQYLQELNIS